MATATRLVTAFTEEQSARLAEVSVRQLRYWDRTGFFQPSYGYENRRTLFSRIYSFDDVVALKVLGQLRNRFNVPLQHLRRVRARLSADQDVWAEEIIYVKDRQVYFKNEIGTFRNALTDEDTLPHIPIPPVIRDVERGVRSLHIRPVDASGRIERKPHLSRRAEVFKGTRIPIKVVEEYLAEGFTYQDIIDEYPALTLEDIRAAVRYLGIRAA